MNTNPDRSHYTSQHVKKQPAAETDTETASGGSDAAGLDANLAATTAEGLVGAIPDYDAWSRFSPVAGGSLGGYHAEIPPGIASAPEDDNGVTVKASLYGDCYDTPVHFSRNFGLGMEQNTASQQTSTPSPVAEALAKLPDDPGCPDFTSGPDPLSLKDRGDHGEASVSSL